MAPSKAGEGQELVNKKPGGPVTTQYPAVADEYASAGWHQHPWILDLPFNRSGSIQAQQAILHTNVRHA